MTDTTTQTTASKTPLPVYTYREIENGKSVRDRVGTAWLHKNGKGCNVDLPLIGKIVVFFEQQPKD